MLTEKLIYKQNKEEFPRGKKEATAAHNKYFHIFVNNIVHVQEANITFYSCKNIYQIFMELKFGENCRTL